MGLLDEIHRDVDAVLREQWTRRVGQKIPNVEDVRLGNDAVELEAVVLYADIADSTALLRAHADFVSAEIYKAFLISAARLIRANNGEIVAYDGDRIMGVFIGGSKCTSAGRTALQINYATNYIVNPRIQQLYSVMIGHAVGVASAKIFVARTGVPGRNDLVWLSEGTNIAAKLCARRERPYTSFMTERVYDCLNISAKISNSGLAQSMWEKVYWPEYSIQTYRSTWWWKPSN
jgi:class 3 adenylate cyclase